MAGHQSADGRCIHHEDLEEWSRGAVKLRARNISSGKKQMAKNARR